MIFINKEFGWIVLMGFCAVQELLVPTESDGNIMFPANIKMLYENIDIDLQRVETASAFVEQYEFVGFL